MSERPEGARSLPLVPCFAYVDDAELDEPLVVGEVGGGIVFLNDPERFAATPEVLVSSEYITCTVRTGGRCYVVDGVTRDGNLVLRRATGGTE